MWSIRCTTAARAACAPHQHSITRSGHTVRIILREDLPPKGYKNDTVTVRAGYARNKLIPTKHAVYAIPANYERFGLVDPLLIKTEKKMVALSDEEVKNKNAAFVLQSYLRNKVLIIWRNALEDGTISPGMVDAAALRAKVSKQLKIDLEDHEIVTIDPTPVNFLVMEKEAAERKVNDNDGVPIAASEEEQVLEECSVQLKRLGEYIATIHLSGGFQIPLKFKVIKR